ncbi:MAG: zinc ribbon domain-containing protein [Anaerolineae bacterium]
MLDEESKVIYCPRCGTANREGSRFCNNCGQDLNPAEEVACPACGHLNPGEAVACANCGATLPSAGPPKEAEEVPEEVPTWLKRLRDLEGGEEEAEAGEKIPTWLLRLRQEGVAPLAEEPAPQEPAPEEPAVEEPTPQGPGVEPLPPEAPVIQPPEPAEAEVPAPEEPTERTGRIDLAQLEEEAVPIEPPSPPPGEGIPLEEAPPSEAISPEEAEDMEPAASEGILAGLVGVLTERTAFPRPRRRQPTSAVPLAGTEQASVFEEIVTGPAIPAPVEKKEERERLSPTLVRWLIYLLVGGAVILAILLSGILPSGLVPGVTAAAFDQALSNLPEQATVLVSFDYDPSTRGELGPQAGAVLGRLMEQEARILAISLVPEGATLADEALDRSAAAAGDYVYGENYVNLGFVSGEAAGARALTQGLFRPDQAEYREGRRLSDIAIGEGLTGLADVDLIVVLTARPEALRSWIEQVQIEQDQTALQVRMVAGVSAQADPLARPYLRSGQLEGLVVGLLGAAELEALRGVTGPASAAVAPQSLGHLAVLAVILAANLAHLWGRLRGRS